ncbi:hypothetical protein DFJ74DRAFT_706424 [Hyaloraphidium curvatum]|nr:hypothetical protein DFJ74DRAFT_706424 [Hyaloraphidium curvatum]
MADVQLPPAFLDSYVLGATDKDRSAALAAHLVPNSPEALAAAAIHALGASDVAAAEAHLKALDALATGFKERNGYEDARLRNIVLSVKHRVLNAKPKSEAAIKELADFYTSQPLSLARFDHPKPSNPMPTRQTSAAPAYPSKLDQTLIDSASLMQKSATEFDGPEDLEEGTVGALASYVARLASAPKNPDTEGKLRRLLGRTSDPRLFQDPATGASQLPSLLAKLWTDYPDSQFAHLDQFAQSLSIAELDTLAGKVPALWSNAQFVGIYIGKLLPEEDTEETFGTKLPVWTEGIAGVCKKIAAGPLLGLKLRIDLEYLDRVRKEAGSKEDFARFLEYLKLPKRSPVVNHVMYEKYSRSADYKKRGDVEARDNWGALNSDFFPPIYDTEEEALIKDYVEAYFIQQIKEGKDISKDGWKVFADYIEDGWLRRVHAETVLHRTPSPDVTKLAQYLPAPVADLTARVDLEFHRFKNPQRKELKSLAFVVKNAPTVQVNVFGINGLQFYRSRLEANEPIDDAALLSLDLGGLVPNASRQLDFSGTPGLLIHDETLELSDDLLFPSSAGSRKGGLWIVELIGRGKRIRCLVRRGGTLGYIPRLGPAGVRLAVVDGEGRRVTESGTRVWLAGRMYEPDEAGDFLLPFSRDPEHKTLLLVSQSRGLVVPRGFYHPAESYSLSAAFVLNREAVAKGNKVSVLVRPSIMLNGEREMGLGVVDESSLGVRTVDGQGVETVRTVEGFLRWSEGESSEKTYDFVVGENLRTLQLTLTAKVRVISQNRQETLTSFRSFSFNAIDASAELFTTFVRRLPAGNVAVFCLGKTGEPREGETVTVRLKNKFVKRPVDVTLATDASGMVDLGKCADIDVVEVLGGFGSRTWNLVPALAEDSGDLTVAAGKSVALALPRTCKASELRLTKVVHPGGPVVAVLQSAKLSADGSSVVLEKLEAGCYRFEGPGVSLNIRAVKPADHSDLGDWSEGAIVGKREAYARDADAEADQSLQIKDIQVKSDGLEVSLANATESTRVHVVATSFAPFQISASDFAVPRQSKPSGTSIAFEGNSYTASEDLSDELGYVMGRKTKPKELGVLLRKPGVLLSTWKLRSTTLQTTALDAPAPKPQSARMATGGGLAKKVMAMDAAPMAEMAYASNAMPMDANAVYARGAGFGGAPVMMAMDRRMPMSNTISVPSTEDVANYDFLSEPGTLTVGAKPGPDGVVKISLPRHNAARTLQIVVTDVDTTIGRVVQAPGESGIASRDIALAPAWKADEHFTEHNQVSLLEGGQTLVVGATSSASMISTVGKLFELAETLCENGAEKEHYATFRFVTRWGSMRQEEKLAAYGEYSCHELDVFLKAKDPEFFKTVVVPFLSCKAAKEPIDFYCLGDKERCREYLANPDRYVKLNVAEKVLLASVVGGDLESIVSRWVSDEVRKKDTRPGAAAEKARFREKLFRIVMASAGGPEDEGSADVDKKADAFMEEAAAPPPPPAQMTFGAAPPMSRAMAMPAPAPMAAMAPGAGPQMLRQREAGRGGLAKRSQVRREMASGGGLYEPLEATSEWGERQYWKRSRQETPYLVESSTFWKDWIRSTNRAAFLSENFGEALRNRFTETMFAIALLQIGFADASGRDYEMAGSPGDPSTLTISARKPMIVFHKGYKESTQKLLPSILVSQKYFDPMQRQFFDEEVGENVDRYIEPESGDKFMPFRIYGCQVTLTNTSALQHLVTVLFQIPEGAIPLSNSVQTKSQTMSLQPFQTTLVDFSFYFPKPGKYGHYPVHVSDRRQTVVAFGNPVTLTVERLQQNEVGEDVKRQFWWVASEGTLEELLAWLADERNTFDNGTLGPLLWRLKDAAAFRDIVSAVRKRGVFDSQLWSYSLLHKSEPEMREWMAATPWITQNSLPFMRGSVFGVDQFELGNTEIVEYWPLVNARAYQIANRPRMNNREAIATYESVLRYLFYKPPGLQTGLDRLHLVCLLLLQDRSKEARDVFARLVADVDSGMVTMEQRMQFDYAKAWLSFLDDSPDNGLQHAREAVAKYKDYPVPHWNRLFQEIGKAVRDLDALRHGVDKLPSSEAGEELAEVADESSAAAQGAREARMVARARKEPRLEVKYDPEGGKLRLSHANLDSCTVGFHPLDLEIEFSSRPFALTQGEARAAAEQEAAGSANPALFVWPTETQAVELAAGDEESTVPLPAAYRNRSVVIDVTAAGGEIVRSRVAGGSAIVVQVLDKSGMVQVAAPSPSGLKPLASAYVKVYARLTDKSVAFYKDGHTDLLGRFDYASLSNTSLLKRCERFAIFVSHDELGSTVREGGVPKS